MDQQEVATCIEEIPDREQMRAAIGEGHAPAWKIGNSPLEIVRIDGAPNQGKYLFSQVIRISKGDNVQ